MFRHNIAFIFFWLGGAFFSYVIIASVLFSVFIQLLF